MTFATRLEAEFAQGLLESHGIKAMVAVDDCGGMRSHLAFTGGGAKLFVLDDEAQRALAILENPEGDNGT